MSRRRPRTRYVETRTPTKIPLPRLGEGVIPDCPHCGGELAWLTRAEWQEHCAVYGVRTMPVTSEVPTLPGVQHPWWFCHGCLNGGALVLT